MRKGSGCDENGLKKGAWTEDEDMKLTAYIKRYGHWNWSLLPKFAGVSRSGKSCRLRWMNYLRPNMKHGNFTEEEDNVIISLHNKLGNKWSTIASKLPGRSDNEIKNRWNTHLKKRVKHDQTMSGSENTRTVEPDQPSPEVNPVVETDVEFQQEDGMLFPGQSESPSSSSSTDLLSCWFSGIDSAGSSDLTPQTFDDEMVGDFWTDSFIPDIKDSSIVLGDNLWSPFNQDHDYMYQSSCLDMLMTDEYLWPTFDTYVKDNEEIN
ncbi:hypothetical protein M8C21_015580 [Ambrosia artemisiifolia]|uniref:Homeodomain-like protein n=1 Tax=Ambrosia artemisiifolia TaxID=4212 RepID=A0AAD5CY12_AMBAR|nr:hypothetical protein M8C21_015580 [Ambrosia artemisiifolia]